MSLGRCVRVARRAYREEGGSEDGLGHGWVRKAKTHEEAAVEKGT